MDRLIMYHTDLKARFKEKTARDRARAPPLAANSKPSARTLRGVYPTIYLHYPPFSVLSATRAHARLVYSFNWNRVIYTQRRESENTRTSPGVAHGCAAEDGEGGVGGLFG